MQMDLLMIVVRFVLGFTISHSVTSAIAFHLLKRKKMLPAEHTFFEFWKGPYQLAHRKLCSRTNKELVAYLYYFLRIKEKNAYVWQYSFMNSKGKMVYNSGYLDTWKKKESERWDQNFNLFLEYFYEDIEKRNKVKKRFEKQKLLEMAFYEIPVLSNEEILLGLKKVKQKEFKKIKQMIETENKKTKLETMFHKPQRSE